MTEFRFERVEPETRFDPGRPNLTIIAPIIAGKVRVCIFCGFLTYRKIGGSKEHLVPSYLADCFAQPRRAFVAPAHATCNSEAGGALGKKLDRMTLWTWYSLHPKIRRALPRGTGGKRDVPGRWIKRGQGAWK